MTDHESTGVNGMGKSAVPGGALGERGNDVARADEISALRKAVARQGERIDALQKKVLSLYQVVDTLCERILQLYK